MTAPEEPPRRPFDPLIGVAAGVAIGIAVIALHRPRIGLFIVAGALATGAALRLLLRPRAAGSLVVRGRQVDVVILGALAVALAVLAAVTPRLATG